MTRTALLVILALAACGRVPAGGREIADAALSDAGAPAPARVEELRVVARSLDALAAVSAGTAEIEQALPPWVFSSRGAIIEPVDDRARGELRAIIEATGLDPRVRALALLRLDQGKARIRGFGRGCHCRR